MRKFLLIVTLLIFSMQMFAQIEINGKVTTDDGDTFPGITVSIEGKTATAVVTDDEGNYSIVVNSESDVLVFEYVGFQTQMQTVGTQTVINVILVVESILLDDVVITALGIKREKKALGYAVQEISGEDITSSGQADIIGAMQGKVSGVNITQAGGAGASTRIVIRGANSLDPGAENQPLFVVDGIPISNSTISGDLSPSAGSNATSTSEQFGFSNRAMDINPNDIESMSILKGAAATALYGARAANGAVIITTKSGKNGKTVINYNSKITIDEVVHFPEMQKTWERGRLSTTDLDSPPVAINETELPPYLYFEEFGYRRADVGAKFYNNMEDFFKQGISYNNSVSVSGGGEKGNYYLSASSLSQEGIVPNTTWGRKTVKLSGSRNVNDKLKTSASVTYTNSGGIRGNHGDKSYMSSMLYWSGSVDMSDYEDENGAHVTHPYIDNPYYLVNKTSLEDDVNRVLGYVNVSCNILENLVLSYRLGTDYYSDARTYIVPGAEVPGEQPLDLASQNGGYIVEERINFMETNSDLMLVYNVDITDDFKFSAVLGNNVLDSRYDRLNTRGENWASPNFYDISNTTNKYSSNSDIRKRMVGLYGNFRFEFKNYLFIGITGRNDFSSTLPTENNSYFYPAANLGFIFTEAFDLKSNILSYGKIRGSWANVAKDAPAHRLEKLYSAGTFLNTANLTLDNSLGNSNLKPEQTTSIETGIDLRFFANKLGIDFSWYKANTVDMLFPIPVANTTGYSTILENIGELENKGIELLITGKIIRKQNFNWEISVNYSENKTKVIELNDELEEIELSNGLGGVHQKLVVGGYYGDMYGYTYKKYLNEDGSESVIINEDGRPTIDGDTALYYGNSNPDWTCGITNTISYKGFTLSFLFETKQGQMMSNEHVRNLIRQGKHISTEYRPTASEGGIILEGVNLDENGENPVPNIYMIERYRHYYKFRVTSDADEMIEEASWIRLRTLSLTYSVPQKILSKTKLITAASFSFVGNNLWLSTEYRGFDPEISKYGAGSNSQAYSGYSTPNTRRLGFSINLTF